MNATRACFGVAIATCLLCLPPSQGWGDDPVPSQKLVIGTKESPPFAFKNLDDRWTGISIELWRHLADELNLEYEFRELNIEQLLAGLESGELDAAVAAISVTAERHRRVDFCHPHFTTGLGIAVSATRSASSWSLAQQIVSSRLMVIVGITIGIVIGCGILFWSFERRGNQNSFGGTRRQGIGMGVWWSIILLMGHKGIIPVSALGRLIAACSMIASILLVSLLTGVIASVLTVQQLEVGIAHASDLRHVRTVTVASSTSADYLRSRRIGFRTQDTAQAALQSIVDGQADAVVYDQALLKYLVNSKFADSVQVLPISFNTQEYAIALQPGSELRKPLNETLLRFRATDSWDDIVFRFLGG